MNTTMDAVLNWTVESYATWHYICTGDEADGELQEAIVDGNTSFFYLYNIHEGAEILYKNGIFYTDDPTMTLEYPSYTYESIIYSSQSADTINVTGRGTPGTEQGGKYYGTVPAALQGQNVNTVVAYDDDGVPDWYCRNGDDLIKVPLLSNAEIEYYNGADLYIKMVNSSLDGTIVEVT